MAAFTVSNFQKFLKYVWTQSEQEILFYEGRPFFAMVNKDDDWVGEIRPIVLEYAPPAGGSSDFTTAKANKRPAKLARFMVETADNFMLWSVDHKLLQLARNDKGAMANAWKSATRGSMEKLARRFAWQMWGNGGGAIGRLASGVTLASTNLDLRDVRKVRNFEIGDKLKLSSDDGVAGAGVRAGVLEVTQVIREGTNAGRIVVDQNISTAIPTATANDYVFIEGDYGAVCEGVASYVYADNSPPSIWTQARTDDPTRLAGIRVSGAGLLIEEAIKKALTAASNNDAMVDHIFLHPDNFNDLDLALGTRRRYADAKVGSVGFTGIEFASHNGKPVECYPDPDVTYNVAFGLTLNKWTLASAGGIPIWLTPDGKPLAEESANAQEGRLGAYAQLYTPAPGKNFRLSIDGTA
jgi:hypothetical protein